MVGGAIGIITGFIGFLILKRFVLAITHREKITILLGILQPLFIISSLLACAVCIPEQLHWAGAGVAAAIITFTIITAIRSINKDKLLNAGIENKKKEANS